MREPMSLARAFFEPAWRRDEAQLYHHLPYATVWNDRIVWTRDGDLMAAIEVDGINGETAGLADQETDAARLGTVIGQAGSNVSFYVHRFSTPARTARMRRSGNLFADALEKHHVEGLNAQPLYDRAIVITVLVRKTIRDRISAFTGSGLRDTEESVRERIDRLEGVIGDLEQISRRATRLTRSDGRWFGLMSTLLSGEYHPVKPVSDLEAIACLIGEDPILARRKSIVFPDREDRQAIVLSLKNYPQETDVSVFDELDLPVDMVVTQSFSPLSTPEVLEAVRRRRGQMRSSGDAAVSLDMEMGEAADDLASGRMNAGRHHMSIVVFGTRHETEAITPHLEATIRSAGGALCRESMCARAIFFAQHPGNFAYRARTQTVSCWNFADMACLHARPKGQTDGVTPWKGALAWLPTTQGEVFALTLHDRPETASEMTAGHSVIVGPTGSGKSVFAAYLLAQAKQLGVRFVVFDKLFGLKGATTALGASYHKVEPGLPTGFNPLETEIDDAGIGWLTNWMGRIVSHTHPLRPEQENAIADAVRENADPELAADLRRFDHFISHFGSLDDDGDLARRFQDYTSRGKLGWLFNGGGRDPFLDARADLAFDITDILDAPVIRLSWLSYVLRRIELRCRDLIPTMILIDESWELLDDDYFADVLKAWFVTLRKQNCVVVLLNQYPEQILQSRASKAILQSIKTRLILPNAEGSDEAYEALGLNDLEIGQVRAKARTRQVLAKNLDASVWLDSDLGHLGDILDVLAAEGRENVVRDWFERHRGFEEVA